MHAWNFEITSEGEEIIGMKNTRVLFLNTVPIKDLLLSTLHRFLTAPLQPSLYLTTKIKDYGVSPSVLEASLMYRMNLR